ncbi:MAG: hypothetical protein IJI49_00270 [Bacilli bacterium]|nr:hypothetical protein [Bacilli bacterium]
MNNKYDDIININYPFTLKHPRMSLSSRAGQFAPFAALTGYSDIIKEEGRVTSDKFLMMDDEFVFLDRKLRLIRDNIDKKYEITFNYFVKDNLKEGGKYISTTGIVKKIDDYRGIIKLFNSEEIIIDNIVDIICDDLFNNYIQ